MPLEIDQPRNSVNRRANVAHEGQIGFRPPGLPHRISGIHRVKDDRTIGMHWEPTNVLNSVINGYNFGHIVREFENKLVWSIRPSY